MRGRVAVLVTLAMVAAPASLAQTQDEQRPEAMALTDEAPSGVSPDATTGCGSLAVHGLAEPGQTPEETAKATTSSSTAAFGCTTVFRAPAPGAFNLTADATLEVYIGCEQPTVMHQPLNNVRVWLVREGQGLTEGAGALSATCSPGQPLSLEVSLPQPDDPTFNASAMFGVNVTVFGSPNLAMDNLHVLVGGNETASTLHLPGLSQAYETEEVEDQPETNESDAPNGTNLAPQSSADDEDGNGIPGPGMAATLAALAGLALAQRRTG